MSSPLDQSEVDALMAAIQDGRVAGDAGKDADAPVVPYDLTSQDRIIRGQMPTLDSINERVASTFGSNLAGRTRLDVRVSSAPSTLMKFVDVGAMFAPPTTVWVVNLGPGHGLGVLLLDGPLGRALLSGALGDRKGRVDAGPAAEARLDLTSVERMVLKHLLGMFTEAMAGAWVEIISFKPEVLRCESDPRMAMVAPPSDLAILCSYELAGAVSGRLQIAIPYATVEPVKKMLTSPPRPGSSVDARFSAALAQDLENVPVEVRVEMGRTSLSFSKLLDLKVGDLLVLEGSESSPLPVYVQGRRKLSGSPRVAGGSLAVVLDQGFSAARSGRSFSNSSSHQ
ncbi:MAG: FliM/FliN family flagellar motor switch protein [Polyangia bacterium]